MTKHDLALWRRFMRRLANQVKRQHEIRLATSGHYATDAQDVLDRIKLMPSE